VLLLLLPQQQQRLQSCSMTFEAVTRLQTSPANSVVDARDDESAHTHR